MITAPFGNAKMRCFRNSLGQIVWILEHELIRATSLSGDWRNYDLKKLADDFRREIPERMKQYTPRTLVVREFKKPWLARLRDAIGAPG